MNRTVPVADRPVIPGYGVPDTVEGTQSWGQVTERLAQAKNYWISTASADGRPHAVPVWGIWLDDVLYFGAGPRTMRNLRENPRVSIHLESGDDVVIVEGTVESANDPDGTLFSRYVEAFGSKYDYRPEEVSGYRLRAEKAYTWTSFPADATRWTF
jgi:hypothetical protein